MLKYTSNKEDPQLGVYTKKIDKGDDGFGPPISSVVVVRNQFLFCEIITITLELNMSMNLNHIYIIESNVQRYSPEYVGCNIVR